MPEPELDELARKVDTAIAAERGVVARVRAWSRLSRFAMVALLIGVIAMMTGTLSPRSDMNTMPRWRLVAVIGVYVVIALAAVWHALRPLWLRRLSPWVSRLLVCAGLVIPFVHALLPELPTHEAHISSCLANGTLLGLSVLLLARAVDRGGHRGTDEALLAAAGGGVGGVMALHLQCPINHVEHLLTAHAPVPLLLLGLYWVLRRT